MACSEQQAPPLPPHAPVPMPSEILVLPSLDQVAPRDYSKFHLFYHLARQPENNAEIYEPLKTSLLWAFKRWPMLTGRVVQDANRGKVAVLYDKTKVYTIDDLAKQALTTSSEPHISYNELAEKGMPSNRHLASLFTRTPDRPLADRDGGAPLFRIHLCIIKNGLVISVYKHHSVFDGSALNLFMRFWAEKHKQLSYGQAYQDWPHRELTWQTARNLSSTGLTDQQDVPRGYALRTAAVAIPNAFKQQAAVGRIFKFETGFLTNLARQIEQNFARVSTQDVLTALLWIHVTQVRSRHLEASRSKIFIPVDVRKLLWPDIQNPQYMGNAVVWTYAECSIHSLVTAAQACATRASGNVSELAKIAHEIRRAVNLVDQEYVLHRLAWFDNGDFDFCNVSMGGNYNNGPDLYLTSWRRLFTEVDFGGTLGRTQFVRKPYLPVDGANILLPQCQDAGRSDEKTYLELYVQLNENDMTELCREDNGMRLWADDIVYEMEEPMLGV